MSSNLSTFDGRLLIGELRGCNQATCLIRSAAKERTISPDEPFIADDFALYILRGNNVALLAKLMKKTLIGISLFSKLVFFRVPDGCTQGKSTR